MTSTWHPLLQLIVLALGVARIVHLIVEDRILESVRGRVLARLVRKKHDKLVILLGCVWCVGWWVTLAWSLAWLRWPDGTTLWAIPWAVAMAAWWFGGSWLGED